MFRISWYTTEIVLCRCPRATGIAQRKAKRAWNTKGILLNQKHVLASKSSRTLYQSKAIDEGQKSSNEVALKQMLNKQDCKTICKVDSVRSDSLI